MWIGNLSFSVSLPPNFSNLVKKIIVRQKSGYDLLISPVREKCRTDKPACLTDRQRRQKCLKGKPGISLTE